MYVWIIKDVNNLYQYAMSQKLPGDGFKWVKDLFQFNNKDNDIGCFLEVDIQYCEKLHQLLTKVRLLPERLKIGKDVELVAIFFDKKEYAVRIRNVRQALSHGFVLKKSSYIKFNQQAWLKAYIDVSAELRKNAKKIEFFFYSYVTRLFLEKF